MKYRKKLVVIEATQWFKNGDHPKDNVWRAFEDIGFNACLSQVIEAVKGKDEK